MASCVACVGMAAAGQSTDLTYGDLASGEFGTGSALNRCQRSVGKETARFLRTAAKALGGGWAARLRGQHANACPARGDGKAAFVIAAAETRKVARICAACGGGDACGGSGDFTPSEIGFSPACPDVTVPSGHGCGGPVSGLQQLVDCADCVSDFDAECAAVLAVPSAAPYPAVCGPPTTTSTTTPSSSTSTSTTLAPCPLRRSSRWGR